MASTSFLCSPILPRKPFSSGRRDAIKQRRRKCSTTTFAIRRDDQAHEENYSRRLVDENMIVLRKRIHEMKMIERNYEPPAEWMDWEKNYYARYDTIICEAMGFLQSQLMNTRPSLALGMIVLITLSVPTSMAMVMFQLMELTKGVLAGIHLS